MDISTQTLRLALLLAPGGVFYFVYDRLVGFTRRERFWFFVYSAIYAILAYVLVAFGMWILRYFGVQGELRFFQAALDPKAAIDAAEVGWATVTAATFAVLAAVAMQRKWISNALGRIGLSHRIVHPDIWHYVFSDPDYQTWVVVRDVSHNLAYHGWLKASSEGGLKRELLLSDVSVYRNDDLSTPIYSVDHAYLPVDESTVYVDIQTSPTIEGGSDGR